jgi:carboxypeptidase Q
MIRFQTLRGIGLILPLALMSGATQAQQTPGAATDDVVARIKDEGLNRSQVMQTLSYLSDVIGPRLTASPNMLRANEWTRDKLTEWGLSNAHLETWGPFGRGWSLERFSAQVVAPQDIPLIAFPKAWSPGLRGPIVGDVIYLDANNEADLEKYKGKLRGAIVFTSPIREVKAHFEPQGERFTDEQLKAMEDAVPRQRGAGRRAGGPPGQRPGGPGQAGDMRARLAFAGRKLQFIIQEGAAVMVEPSPRGDGGTIFVQSATVPQPIPPAGAPGAGPGGPGGPGAGPAGGPPPGGPGGGPGGPPPGGAPPGGPGAGPAGGPPPGGPGAPPVAGALGQPGAARRRGMGGGGAAFRRVSPWDKNAPKNVPQIVVAVEQYNRMMRMLQAGEKLKMAVDLSVKFYDGDLMGRNTVAEIPGSDLKDQLVMLGGHMDSWHSGTGATDNGAGVAVAMEAVRILRALHLQPRRTVRIALWSGEEEGLLGSRAYVAEHFGSRPAPSFGGFGAGGPGGGGPGGAAPGELTKKPEYDKLSGYFNLDNGTGKIRGVYLQGNAAVGPIFREWLAPFKDMGAATITINNTGGTDHQSFDGIGIPGFQFIQDTIEYDTRTHHSNEDVFDRIQEDDLKQAAVIMATFVYNTAVRDEMLPRKEQPTATN